MNNNSINIYGNASDVQIQQGSSNSVQTNFNGMEVDKFQSILDQINKYRSQIPDEFGEKSAALLMALDDAQEALNTRNVSGWRKAIHVIRDLAIGVGGSIIASGILGLLSPIQ